MRRINGSSLRRAGFPNPMKWDLPTGTETQRDMADGSEKPEVDGSTPSHRTFGGVDDNLLMLSDRSSVCLIAGKAIGTLVEIREDLCPTVENERTVGVYHRRFSGR